MQENKKVYKIKNGKGLYSRGGSFPNFNKNGKIWTTRGALSNHLNLLDGKIPSDWIIEEFELVTTSTKLNEMPAADYELTKIVTKINKINQEPDNLQTTILNKHKEYELKKLNRKLLNLEQNN